MIKGRAFLTISTAILAFIAATPFFTNAKEADMKLTSPEFENNGYIPKKFTCQGEDVNPSLAIAEMPAATKTLALIVDDPDAPMGTWVHWVVFNIPATDRIEEKSVPGMQGITSNGATGYHGPCPPSGTHRYFFKIYAIDNELKLPENISKNELMAAMKGHILGEAQLIGLYKKE